MTLDQSHPSHQSLALRTLPSHPSLEQLRNQAKSLIAAVRAGDPSALERYQRYFPPRLDGQDGSASESLPRSATLTRAQLVIAREHGFTSWMRLRQAVGQAPLRALLEKAIERPIDWAARRNAMETLAAAGPSGIRVALDALSDPDPKLRGAALGFIDHHATDTDVPKLLEVAKKDPVPYVRRAAIHALSCERCKPAPLSVDPVPVLLDALLHDPTPRVRHTAAQTLRPYLDRPGVRDTFRTVFLTDTSGRVRSIALHHVVAGDDVLELMVRALRHDPDARVRMNAALKLRRLPPHPLAVEALEVAVREDLDPFVRREAHRALKHQSPEYWLRTAQHMREANLARGTNGEVSAFSAWLRPHRKGQVSA